MKVDSKKLIGRITNVTALSKQIMESNRIILGLEEKVGIMIGNANGLLEDGFKFGKSFIVTKNDLVKILSRFTGEVDLSVEDNRMTITNGRKNYTIPVIRVSDEIYNEVFKDKNETKKELGLTPGNLVIAKYMIDAIKRTSDKATLTLSISDVENVKHIVVNHATLLAHFVAEANESDTFVTSDNIVLNSIMNFIDDEREADVKYDDKSISFKSKTTELVHTYNKAEQGNIDGILSFLEPLQTAATSASIPKDLFLQMVEDVAITNAKDDDENFTMQFSDKGITISNTRTAFKVNNTYTSKDYKLRGAADHIGIPIDIFKPIAKSLVTLAQENIITINKYPIDESSYISVSATVGNSTLEYIMKQTTQE